MKRKRYIKFDLKVHGKKWGDMLKEEIFTPAIEAAIGALNAMFYKVLVVLFVVALFYAIATFILWL